MPKRSRSESSQVNAGTSKNARARSARFRLATSSAQQPLATRSSRIITLKPNRRRARKEDRQRVEPPTETPPPAEVPVEIEDSDEYQDIDIDGDLPEFEPPEKDQADSLPKQKRIRFNTTSVTCLLVSFSRCLTSLQTKLVEWLPFRASFLDEILRHDGRADYRDPSCFSCRKEGELYKCRDCFTGGLLRCKGCTLKSHGDHPLHRVEVRRFLLCVFKPANFSKTWNGLCFVRTTLKDMGLRVQLGHAGAACVCPLRGPIDFFVIHTTGFHSVAVDFCDCRHDGPIHKRTQLLRAGWFPATFNRPQTVFTFDVLSTFHELTLQGKTTIYDFYHAIVRLSNNTELIENHVSTFFS